MSPAMVEVPLMDTVFTWETTDPLIRKRTRVTTGLKCRTSVGSPVAV